jgi:hypothetical protein
MITVLVGEAYLGLGAEDVKDDDIAVRNIAEAVASRMSAESAVLNPTNTEEDLNRLKAGGTEQLVAGLQELVAIGDRALGAPAELEAAIIWAEAFGHFFPIPELADSDQQSKALVEVKFVPEVSVEAASKNNSNVRFRGVNEIKGVPRDCTIRFVLTNANELPAGATIHWMVRNEGEEAEFRNDLGHDAGAGRTATDETSAYKGTHFMDVVVKSAYREILGFRRIPVGISGAFVPPRNPTKPGWTRFNRRR